MDGTTCCASPRSVAIISDAYGAFLQAARDAGEWPEGTSVAVGARYLSEQVALAIVQRASAEDAQEIRDALTLALSVFTR